MPTLFLSRNDTKDLLNIADVIRVVEDVFKSFEQGRASMPPKAYLAVEHGDFRAMPAAIPGAAGLKWVNSHPNNPSRDLPTVMAILVYNDPETGYPLAIMDATEITAYRTAATSAIASKYLARPDSNVLGIIGAGRQAYMHILAHAEIFKLKLIKIFDKSISASDKLIHSLPDYPIKKSSPEDTAASDILCTLTPSREPVVKSKWIIPGTHINAIGADAAGKEELDPAILKESMVVVDDIRQARAAGEINVPIAKNLFTVDEVYATIGELIAGNKRGRTDSNLISIFDSTGIAIEDIATARLVYKKAVDSGSGMSIEFV